MGQLRSHGHGRKRRRALARVSYTLYHATMALPLSRELHQMAKENGLAVYVRFAWHWLLYRVWRRFLGVLLGTRHLVRLEEMAKRERMRANGA